jgi:transcriptional regulator with XRE-family HTH domain
MAVAAQPERAGELLREWRRRRSLSQLDLALSSAVSARHLSFIETGRARPSREMLLHLAQRLEMPLRERNRLLLAAGFAPVFGERTLDQPEMAPIRAAVERLLAAHEPYPAAAHDTRWTLVSANRGVEPLLEGIDPQLLEPPANILRATLHPDGLAPRIINFAECSAQILRRLEREISVNGDPELVALYEELASYPGVTPDYEASDLDLQGAVFVPLRLRYHAGELSFFTTVTSFGTPLDITVADLVIESFYPADASTAETLARLHRAARGAPPRDAVTG